MNVLLIWSSPNIDGLTAQAKDRIVRGLEAKGAVVETAHLNHLYLEHCRACGHGWGTCQSQGRCVIKDDFADLYDKCIAAEGIVFVTAVYWHDLTEQMKAFLDRLRRCEAGHNGALSGKRCLLAACAGGTGRGVLECLGHLETTLGHMQMRAYDRIGVIRYNCTYMLDTLEAAGSVYAERLATGFDMMY